MIMTSGKPDWSQVNVTGIPKSTTVPYKIDADFITTGLITADSYIEHILKEIERQSMRLPIKKVTSSANMRNVVMVM